tara:strand:- start:1351 stop:1539 length:189 start_codon:yes stop_codon:yes gene_type:complete
MKTNFKNEKKTGSGKKLEKDDSKKKDITKEEFEEFIIKSGAKGSFMVYRSNKKDDELGMDEL